MSNFSEDVINAIKESEFEINCPTCDEEFAVAVSDVGKSVTCPKCGQLINLNSGE